MKRKYNFSLSRKTKKDIEREVLHHCTDLGMTGLTSLLNSKQSILDKSQEYFKRKENQYEKAVLTKSIAVITNTIGEKNKYIECVDKYNAFVSQYNGSMCIVGNSFNTRIRKVISSIYCVQKDSKTTYYNAIDKKKGYIFKTIFNPKAKNTELWAINEVDNYIVPYQKIKQWLK